MVGLRFHCCVAFGWLGVLAVLRWLGFSGFGLLNLPWIVGCCCIKDFGFGCGLVVWCAVFRV